MTESGESRAVGEVVAIAAVCANRVIGGDGDQPWKNRDDFARFRRLTMDQVLIMGRRTFAAIGRPLPGRHTVVLTRDPGWRADGVSVAHELDGALALAAERWPSATRFVSGGGEVYRLAWPVTTRLELTEVDTPCPGDVTFPPVTAVEWHETAREPRDGFAWVSYVRAR